MRYPLPRPPDAAIAAAQADLDGGREEEAVALRAAAAVNGDQQGFALVRVAPDQLAALITRIEDGTISGKIAKELFDQLWRAADSSIDVDWLARTLLVDGLLLMLVLEA